MKNGNALSEQKDGQPEVVDYKALVEGINDVIYEVGFDGRFSYVSPVVKDVYGYESVELVGKYFGEFVHEEDLLEVVEKFELTLSGKNPDNKFEFRILNKDGSFHWVRTSSKIAQNSKGESGLRGLMVDISERKRDQESILNYMHILNHDLRSPLSSIINFSDLLLDGNFTREEVSKFNGFINESGKKMMSMMESYLTLEKVERGQVKLVKKPETVLNIISKIKKDFSEIKNNGFKINIIFKNPINNIFNPEIVQKSVSIDETLFLSMISNLLKNSIEALYSIESIEKIVMNIFEEDNKFCISISNSGEIPEDARKNLFKKFYTSKSSGTGIGLYSAKLIAEAHGGSLTYQPLPGRTRFTIQIPF